MTEKIQPGFTYTVERVCRKTGEVLDREVVHNLMPKQGANHVLDVLLNGAVQVSTWYILPFGNNYTPQTTDTAATFPTSAGELTNYAGATRAEFNGGPANGGVVDNSADLALLEFDAPVSVQGCALISQPTKGGAGGILLSAAKFSSPKSADAETVLRILGGIEIIPV